MSISLNCRRFAWQACTFIAPFLARTGIGKIRFREKKLGSRIFSVVTKLLHHNLPETVEVHGMVMYHRAPEGRGYWGWLYPFDYEPETQHVFKKIVQPGMTVVDVGAHIGFYTLLAASLLAGKGKVYAFEPDPSYYALLEKNIWTNDLATGIVEPIRVAVGDREGRATLFLGQSTGTGLFKNPDSTDQRTVVDVITLDKFFADRGWPSVHVIKMDIEGSEKAALEGMRVTFKKNPSLKLIIEFNPSSLEAGGTSPEDLLRMLRELGFKRLRVLSHDMKVYEIPQEIPHLTSLARDVNYLNLLSEK